MARRAGLHASVLTGSGFTHQAYSALRGDNRLIVIFIEGDGRPWVHGGRVVATDPTPRKPLALELATRTPASVLYLGRPCYFDARSDTACAQRYWTSDRYSVAVVSSMVVAATGFVATHGFRQVLLVGYSGGGALAVLMARDVPHTVGVVTVAGNLDPDAWTHLHGYMALAGSLNPSAEAPLPSGVREWHLIGGRDVNVPFEAAGRYLTRVPDRVWRYPSFDHACCWVQAWPEAFMRITAELGGQ